MPSFGPSVISLRIFQFLYVQTSLHVCVRVCVAGTLCDRGDGIKKKKENNLEASVNPST